jgi:hypothetical protein
MKRFARPEENKLVVSIPPVGRLRIIRIQVELGIIVIQVEHVRVAVAVSNVQSAFRATAQCEGFPIS